MRTGEQGARTSPDLKTAPAAKAIAVLPLANMSADPENEYFSDGMTEEIINALAKVPGMQVASRTSSFAFKGKEVDVRQIGEKLGVTSVLEGSVRKVGNRVRITAQLIRMRETRLCASLTGPHNLMLTVWLRSAEDPARTGLTRAEEQAVLDDWATQA